MLYELRIYECVPGRLPDLNKRFDTITLKLWEKHGIKQAGFWTTVIGKSNQTLYYMLAWESLAEREKKWNAFGVDPEWLSARAQTEANGPIVANVKEFHSRADAVFIREVTLAVSDAGTRSRLGVAPDLPRCRTRLASVPTGPARCRTGLASVSHRTRQVSHRTRLDVCTRLAKCSSPCLAR